jgi:uncharacterized protein YhbP (UPF0306 family)
VTGYTNFECGQFLLIWCIGVSALPITAAAYFIFSIRNVKFPLYSVGKKEPSNVLYTLDIAVAAPAMACSRPSVGKAGWNPLQYSRPTSRNSLAPSWP